VTRRRVVFAIIACVTAFIATIGGLVAVDGYLHSKYQTSAGFNVWGYRGPAVGRKRPGEYRVVMLGGSSAYGYGVRWDRAIPALLEADLGRAAPAGRTFRVVNLGYNNEGAYSFTFTMQDYDYLRYDLVCLYEGYNDLMADERRPNVQVFRHDSPVFRLTGYLPIFPLVFKEKAAAILSGGDPGSLYRDGNPPGEKTVFRPGLAARAAASVLTATGDAGQAVERQLDRVRAEAPHHVGDVSGTGCRPPWAQYCKAIADAIDLARARHHDVLFITQPYERIDALSHERHVDQQREAIAMVQRRYAADRRVKTVNLGEAVDLRDRSLSFDGMHLTADGNARIAAQLVAPVLSMAGEQGGE
jgi:GDSL-like Lipase/Acylhydrolase family